MSDIDPTLEMDTLDGETIELHTVKFEPVQAYRLLAKIGRVLIPAVLAARSVDKNANAIDLKPAVDTLFEKLTPELADTVLLESLACSSVRRKDENGEREKIELTTVKKLNRAFRGNLKLMLLAVKHALEVNYTSFFVVSGTPAAASETPTPSL